MLDFGDLKGTGIIGSAEALPTLCVRYFWWERERERDTDRQRRKWRHHCRAKIGDEFTLPLPKIRTIHHMPWTAHASTTAACPPFCGYSAIPLDTHMHFFSHEDRYRRKLLGSFRACLWWWMKRSVHVLSLEDDVGCVVAVEARELLAESGRARQTTGGTTFPQYQGVSITLAKMQGNWALTVPCSYRSPLILICYLLAFSCHANDKVDISFLFTRIFLWSCHCWHAATITRF